MHHQPDVTLRAANPRPGAAANNHNFRTDPPNLPFETRHMTVYITHMYMHMHMHMCMYMYMLYM